MLNRYLIYRSAASRNFLCICAARDKRHALKIARQNFRLERTAYAVAESSQYQQTLITGH